MFKWLANLIVNSPVQGTCACGASHRAKLRQMQKEILAENGADVPDDAVWSVNGRDCARNYIKASDLGVGLHELNFSTTLVTGKVIIEIKQ